MKSSTSRILMTVIILAVVGFCIWLVVRKNERFLFGSEPATIQLTVPKLPTDAWVDPYFGLCSKYDVKIPADREEIYPVDPSLAALGPEANQGGQCPDSSFTFVDDLSRFVPNSPAVPSCIQLKESPYCYSLPNGKYKPNIYHLKNVSP